MTFWCTSKSDVFFLFFLACRNSDDEPVFVTKLMKETNSTFVKNKTYVPWFDKCFQVQVHSGYVTVNEAYNSNIFFTLVKAKVSYRYVKWMFRNWTYSLDLSPAVLFKMCFFYGNIRHVTLLAWFLWHLQSTITLTQPQLSGNKSSNIFTSYSGGCWLERPSHFTSLHKIRYVFK